jgi:hypothetical protein
MDTKMWAQDFNQETGEYEAEVLITVSLSLSSLSVYIGILTGLPSFSKVTLTSKEVGRHGITAGWCCVAVCIIKSASFTNKFIESENTTK